MEHPFINDLTDKTNDEIQSTITGLTGKLSFAYSTGNQVLIHQLHMALESYKVEYQKRMQELMDKQNLSSKIQIQRTK